MPSVVALASSLSPAPRANERLQPALSIMALTAAGVLEVFGALASFAGVDAGRELVGDTAVEVARLGQTLRLLEREGEPHQRVVAREGEGRIIGHATILVHGLLQLAVPAMELGQREPSQRWLQSDGVLARGE